MQEELERAVSAETEEYMPVVSHVERREYMGMFEYRQEDEPLLLRNLVIGQCYVFLWVSRM